jgi:hypothetical protein
MAEWDPVDHDPFDGTGPTFVPVDHDPFADSSSAGDGATAAAARTRQSVRPEGGRQEGGLTRLADRLLPAVGYGLATLPQRVGEASENRRLGGTYDAGPATEAALLTMGASAPFAERGAIGAGQVPPSALRMDRASRYERADQLGFRRDMPLDMATVPADERIAAAAVKANGRVFTAANHSDAMMLAERELGVPFENMKLDPIMDGFVTTSGRYVSRREAADIAERAAQGSTGGLFGFARGLASENVSMPPPGVLAESGTRIGATAPGLPGGQGVWGGLLSPASRARHALWHRAENPGVMDAAGRADHEIQESLRNAWEQGHDAVMLQNYIRPGGKRPETVIVVRDPSQLRSPRAAFDPQKKESSDLLAGIAAALGGAEMSARLQQQDEPKP